MGGYKKYKSKSLKVTSLLTNIIWVAPFWCWWVQKKVKAQTYLHTTPLRQWGFRQRLPFSWTTLCWHPIAVMGVDTSGQSLWTGNNNKQSCICIWRPWKELLVKNSRKLLSVISLIGTFDHFSTKRIKIPTWKWRVFPKFYIYLPIHEPLLGPWSIW